MKKPSARTVQARLRARIGLGLRRRCRVDFEHTRDILERRGRRGRWAGRRGRWTGRPWTVDRAASRPGRAASRLCREASVRRARRGGSSAARSARAAARTGSAEVEESSGTRSAAAEPIEGDAHAGAPRRDRRSAGPEPIGGDVRPGAPRRDLRSAWLHRARPARPREGRPSCPRRAGSCLRRRIRRGRRRQPHPLRGVDRWTDAVARRGCLDSGCGASTARRGG